MALRALVVIACVPPLVFLALGLSSVRLEADAVGLVEAGSPGSATVERAERLLRRAAQRSPSSHADLRRAQLLGFAGRSAEASRLLERIVADEPEHVDAWILLARTARAAGDERRAAQARDRVGELKPLGGRPAP